MGSYITKPTSSSNEPHLQPDRSNKEDAAIKAERNFIDSIARYIGKKTKIQLLLLSSYITRKLYGALAILQELLTAVCKIICFVVTVFIVYQLFVIDSTDFTAIRKSSIAYPIALTAYAIGKGVLNLALLGKVKIDSLISRGLSKC